MRVSTSMIYDHGTSNILRNQASLFKLQNQLSTGRRVLSASDDPVAAAQALVVSQSKNINTQYLDNQGDAKGQLNLVESNLSNLTSLIQDIRERVIQMGDAVLSSKERGFIESELKGRLEDLLGIANAQNGAGQFMFSGYEGATKPFALQGAVFPFDASNPSAQYFGDQGERLLQVEASRQIGLTVPGSDIFMNVRNGNGEAYVSSPSVAPLNAGSGLIDQGSITDLAKWNSAGVAPLVQDYQIQFRVDNTAVPPVTYYGLQDGAGANSLITGGAVSGAPYAAPEWRVYTPGQSIQFSGLAGPVPDIGFQVQVFGSPADGDRFAVKASKNQSLFDTVQNLISIAGQPASAMPGGNADLSNKMTEHLAALDKGLDNVLRVRANVGARLVELDALETAGSDLDLQYSGRLSDLQDLDYAAAISDLNRRQMQLEAAQATFVKVTGLSLFSQLG